MLGARRLLAAAVVAGAILVGVGIATLAAPATSVAACAGCAQYTNPLGSTTQPATQTASQTTSPPATQTATPPPTTPASTGTAVAPADTATTMDPEPTATAASGAAAGSSTTSGQALPRTGFDSWTIVGFGVVLIGGGLVVRRRMRRA
ncbi:MAG: LPXTG cell wall anchor domain-containing protein [Solirubrobacteraceae bacterium]